MKVLFYGVKGNYRKAKDYLLEKGFTLTSNANDIDLVISYLYNKKIPLYMLNCPRNKTINFHPAPLPEGRCSRTYPFAILEERSSYSVTCHHMRYTLDSGPIIKTLTFPIDPFSETCLSLKLKAYDYLLILFKQVIDYFLENNCFPESYEQDETKAQSCTLDELEKMKVVDIRNISAHELKKKIRAFWNPPHYTAKILIGGEYFSIISNEILQYLSREEPPKKYNWVFAECGIIVNPTKENDSN